MTAAGERDRTERAQRVRAGVTGLAAVLVIAGLAGAIFRSASESGGNAQAIAGPLATGNTATAVETSPNEPLADLGVAPPANATAGTEGN